MTDTTAAVALLRHAPGGVRTVHARLEEWFDAGRAFAAYRASEPGRAEVAATAEELGWRPGRTRRSAEVWLAVGGGAREEDDLGTGAVGPDGRWWWRGRDGTRRRGEPGSPGGAAAVFRRWLAPADVLEAVDVAVLDTTVVAGRAALVLRLVPRPGTDPMDAAIDWLGFFADEWLVCADARHGIVLATEARHSGIAFQRAEAVAIELDIALPDALLGEPEP